MKNRLLLLIFVLLFSGFAHALDTDGIKKSVESASGMVGDFFATTDKQDIIIITGSRISLEDKILFNMIKGQVSEIQGIQIEPDTYSFSQAQLDSKNLVLIGGEKTNLISSRMPDLISAGEKTTISPFVLIFSNADRKVMILYSEKEIYNNENKAPERSVLSRIMDKKYVPAAATFLSILLLYIWNIFGRTLMGVISDFSSSKVIQKVTAKKTIRKKEIHPHLRLHEYIDRSEIIALLITSIIFATTMSWTWMKDIDEFRRMFFINIIIVTAISFAREIYRQYLCFRIRIRTEYAFWPFGSFMTLLSTILGNTFSLASYTLLDEGVDEKKFGKICFKISALTFMLSVIAYILNIFFPSLVLQMVFVYSVVVVFIELFPMPPMAGNDIRKWNTLAWAIIYIVVFASYIYMNFTIYV